VTRPNQPPGLPVPSWLSTLEHNLADNERLHQTVAVRPGRGGRPSAVLILIGGADLATAQLLFIERASTMRNHAGQIALPGGGADPGDVGLAGTALREAAEETGLDPGGVTVLGSLPPAHVAVSGFDVTAVVGWWAGPTPVGAQDPAEVAAVHTVPIARLMDPANRVTVRHPSGYTGPAFAVSTAADGAGRSGPQSDTLFIWGLTAHLVDAVADLAGWNRAWDRTVTAEVPQRFLRDRRATPQSPSRSGQPAYRTGRLDGY